MPPRTDTLISRDPCVLLTGLFGQRGQLALYEDRLVFSLAGGTQGWDVAFERIERLALRGRRQRTLVVGFDGGESAFKLDVVEAAGARLRALCALLVQLNPTPPWLDSRFGAVDAGAAAALLAPHGLSLAPGESLDLCEWCLAWVSEDEMRCAWLVLTSRRLLVLNVGSGAQRSPPRVVPLARLERADPLLTPATSLWLVADRELLRFDPNSGTEFVEAFWRLYESPGRGGDQDTLRRTQALERLAGEARLTRLSASAGPDIVLRDLLWSTEPQALVAQVPCAAVEPLHVGDTCAVELVRRSGLFQFEGRIAVIDPLPDGPFKARQARLHLQPASDILFINRRRAFRVEVAIPVRVEVQRPLAGGGWQAPATGEFRLADLSAIGCALVGPADIPESARFAFDLPLGEPPGKLRVIAECVNVRTAPGPQITRTYGMRLIGLDEPQRESIQREVVRQERLLLRRRAALRDRF